MVIHHSKSTKSEVSLITYPINNIPYKIRFVVGEFKDGNVGQVRFFDYEILIRKGLQKEEEISTVFHEWLHVWNRDLDLGLTEDQICGIESAFRDFRSHYLVYEEDER